MNRKLNGETKLLRLILKHLLMVSMLLTTFMVRAEGDWGIDRLMQSLASSRSGSASFVEKKTIAMLDKPVESSGELFYTAPDRLEKRTLKPNPESMLLDKDKLIVEQRGKKHTLSLANYPEVAAFIDSIRGTLAGDRKALERSYKLSLDGDEQNWNLSLLPIEDKMKKVVAKINIAGAGNILHSIEIKQADGDRSLMTITPLPTTVPAP
ncbi:MAG: outer membrane lipoprotein carrier protein LolA [Bacteroidia bacterium]|nr:outer membrane lipoprotein carrier protein LolA [Methylotenera sp.]